MSSLRSRLPLRRGLVVIAVLVVALGALAAYVLLHEPGNVSHPKVEFTSPTATNPAKGRAPVVDTSLWPRYGFDGARTW